MYLKEEVYKRISQQKKQLDKLRPFPKCALERLRARFRILLTYNSNAIEGNTLSLSETKLVVEEGITIGGKTLREHHEAINHQKALALLENFVSSKKILAEEDLFALHSIILDNIIDDERGMYRKRKVWIEGASFLPVRPELISQKMKAFFQWLYDNPEHLHAIELAFTAHEKFVFIHPFIDGNGRIARLLTSVLLMQKGYPPLLILKTERQKYIRTLETAHQGNYVPFVNFMARCLERSLAVYLDALLTADKTEEYISLQDATKYCSYSQEYLSLLARKGALETVKFERNWMTTKKAVEEYVKKQQN
jgi:Fic family protein